MRRVRSQRRVMHVGKVKAWNQWCEAVETVNAQRALMTRTLQRALDAKLHAAWVKWTDLSAARRRMRNVMAVRAPTHRRTLCLHARTPVPVSTLCRVPPALPQVVADACMRARDITCLSCVVRSCTVPSLTCVRSV